MNQRCVLQRVSIPYSLWTMNRSVALKGMVSSNHIFGNHSQAVWHPGSLNFNWTENTVTLLYESKQWSERCLRPKQKTVRNIAEKLPLKQEGGDIIFFFLEALFGMAEQGQWVEHSCGCLLWKQKGRSCSRRGRSTRSSIGPEKKPRPSFFWADWCLKRQAWKCAQMNCFLSVTIVLGEAEW